MGQEGLTKERAFAGVTESIDTGAQAISLDFIIGNEEDEAYNIYGLAERCDGKIDLPEDTTEGDPYRMWTSDHFQADRPKSSMYGVAPII